MSNIRALEGTASGKSEHPLSNYKWTFSESLKVTDAFFARMNYGDLVTFERIQTGETISWKVSIEAMEIGRFILSPIRDNIAWQERYTANSRNGEGDAERAKLFFSIMDDLAGYFYEYLGVDKNTNTLRPALKKIWARQSKISLPAKPGPKPNNKKDKIATRKQWNEIKNKGEYTLRDFLVIKFGSYPNGDPKVPASTFCSWPEE